MSIFFATPCHRGDLAKIGAIAKWAASMSVALRLEGASLGLVSDCPWLDAARADLLAAFLATKCTAILFRDDDVDFPPEVLARMIAARRPIVIAPYRMRREPHHWTHRLSPDGRVVSAGLGAALIARHVIETVVAAHPTYDQDGSQRSGVFIHFIADGRLLKEDEAFWRRVNDAGFSIEMVDAPEVVHNGIPSGPL